MKWYLAALVALPVVCFAAPPELPHVRDLVAGLPFTPEQADTVTAGGIVVTPVVPVAEGELAIGLACLAEKDNMALATTLPSGRWLLPEDNVQATGILEEEPGGEAFAAIQGLVQGSEAVRYSRAGPGEDLNLSAGELDRIGAAGDARPKVVHDLLIERYRAYRNAGTSATEPYARSRGTVVDPGSDLRQSTTESIGVKAYFPAMHETLLRYPERAPAVAEEGFHWITAQLGKREAVLLTHALSMRSDMAEIVVARAYYISHSLNALQAFIVLAPVTEGTLFLYVYRVWLDRVRGFGGTFAAGIARDLMTREMQELARRTGACD